MPAMKTSSQVSIGLGTQLGLVGTLAAGVLAIVQSAEHNQALLSGANKPAAIIAFAAPILTALGRMYQAAHLPKADAVAGLTADIPAELASLAAEAQANVAQVQASPDHVDGPHVAYATGDAPAPAAP